MYYRYAVISLASAVMSLVLGSKTMKNASAVVHHHDHSYHLAASRFCHIEIEQEIHDREIVGSATTNRKLSADYLPSQRVLQANDGKEMASSEYRLAL